MKESGRGARLLGLQTETDGVLEVGGQLMGDMRD